VATPLLSFATTKLTGVSSPRDGERSSKKIGINGETRFVWSSEFEVLLSLFVLQSVAVWQYFN